WETVIIPNGTLVKSQVMILGRRTNMPQLWRRHIDFFIDFRTSPTEVIEAVESALRTDPVPRMARDPAPQVLFIGIKESYANYCIRYWLNDLQADDSTDSAARVRMWFALRRANIPLSIPAASLFLTHESPERDARKAEDEQTRRLAALGSVDLFRGLSDQVRQTLANRLTYTPFTCGEAVTHEGDHDDGLYMIVSGEAAVRISAGGEEREVARLVAGQFFGEMSLMTGEARTASVIATQDLICYRVDKPAFELLLRETPEVADEIAEVLAARRGALSAKRDERDDVKRTRMQTAKQDLLGRIRGFFKIED
nr:cyclic nucleotide-binding domain-containing protein [Deltaproteobacteria bacterium]